MRELIRLLDTSTHGGQVVTAGESWIVNGRPVARMGDILDCPEHGPVEIVTGSETLMIDGKPAARHGDVCACGAVLIGSTEALNV